MKAAGGSSLHQDTVAHTPLHSLVCCSWFGFVVLEAFWGKAQNVIRTQQEHAQDGLGCEQPVTERREILSLGDLSFSLGDLSFGYIPRDFAILQSLPGLSSIFWDLSMH